MKTSKQHITTRAEYDALFQNNNADHREEALEKALDTRKFEIDLYWKRTTYFWTFITLAFAGFFAVTGSEHIIEPSKTELLFLISCIGILFSFGWYLANRGSKFWQENWEKHVSLLEDSIIGSLFKSTYEIPQAVKGNGIRPLRFSVTKINQILTSAILISWLFLALKTISPNISFLRERVPNANLWIVGALTIIGIIVLIWKGRSRVESESIGFVVTEIQEDSQEQRN